MSRVEDWLDPPTRRRSAAPRRTHAQHQRGRRPPRAQDQIRSRGRRRHGPPRRCRRRPPARRGGTRAGRRSRRRRCGIMKVTVYEPQDFPATVRAVRAVVSIAARRGDGAGMPALEERLDVLLASSPEGTGEAKLQTLIEVAHATIVSTMIAGLCEVTIERVVSDLRETSTVDGFADDPWGRLEAEARSNRAGLVRSRLELAQEAAAQACRNYGRTRRTTYLRDAVKSLERARRSEARAHPGPRLTPASCAAGFTRLAGALERSMPARAWAFFAEDLAHRGRGGVPRLGRHDRSELGGSPPPMVHRWPVGGRPRGPADPGRPLVRGRPPGTVRGSGRR